MRKVSDYKEKSENGIINIEFDENKSYTSDEIKLLREQCRKISTSIRHKEEEIDLSGMDFTGKYIKSDIYGYMYVTWQKLQDAFDNSGRKIMFMQGMSHNSELIGFRDSSFFNYDACDEWRIPIDSFIRYVKDGELKEVTKEEFIKAFEDKEKFLKQEFHSWVRILEERQKNMIK